MRLLQLLQLVAATPALQVVLQVVPLTALQVGRLLQMLQLVAADGAQVVCPLSPFTIVQN